MTDPRPPQDVDGLARRLTRREPSPERSAAMRHALLDAAQPPEVEPARGMLSGWWIGAAAAAAAAVCAWLVLRGPDAAPVASTPSGAATSGSAGAPSATSPSATSPSATSPSATSPSVAAAPGAGRASPGDDSAVRTAGTADDDRIPDGTTTFAPTHPVQMTRGTATITAPPDARFDVEVRGDEVKRVTVMAGWVVVASARARTTIVPTRYTWTPEAPVPALTASLSTPASAAPSTTPAPSKTPAPSTTPATAAVPPASRATPSTAAASAPAPAPSLAVSTRTPATSTAAPDATSPASTADAAGATSPRAPSTASREAAPSAREAPQLPGSSERDFRDGLRTLLAGDARGATAPLSRACVAPSSSQDDMCYWAAVAWLRSGDHERARQAFTEMLGRWPGSTHVGEANVALGWLLLEAGDRSGARTRFAAAANDRMASIRANAVRGLAASQ